MSPESTAAEDFISFRGHQVWYRIVGEGEESGKLPLLVLHGGPGAPHDYLEPLEEMAATGRRVIFYDQLGCGNSDRPSDPAMWSVDLFLEELGIIRQELGLDNIHILGQSWGGMLGMEYALTDPEGVASLTVANSPASMIHWVSEANRLRADLPIEVQQILLKHEEAGTTDDPEYEEAMQAFYLRHVCRLDPWPDYVNRAFEKLGDEVYNTMNGPSEFHVIGKLKNWDITDRLGQIHIPTLIISGRYDEATPEIAEEVHLGIPNSEWVLFEHSSHMPHAEEPERYRQVLGDFLSKIEIR